MATGLFVGLVTLDLIYLTPALPKPNQKLVALDYLIAAGGPATNAAITFQYLSNSARLMGVIGCHPVSRFVLAELYDRQIELYDLQPNYPESPPTSSILVTQSTGERAVISINAIRTQASPDQIPAEVLQAADVVLIDGHQMAVGQDVARHAKALQIPVVVDGGSWKPGFEAVLAYTDYAICSANFHPPTCATPADVLRYLESLGIPHIAITQGEQPIIFSSQGKRGEMAVPVIAAVDTLGAGDIFHGAFCHFILRTSFEIALNQASQIAARACQSFGTRQWMEE
jgi:sugar/nucleoside kinase (ribokinase family)